MQQCLITGNWVTAIPHSLYTWDSRTLAPTVVTESFICVTQYTHFSVHSSQQNPATAQSEMGTASVFAALQCQAYHQFSDYKNIGITWFHCFTTSVILTCIGPNIMPHLTRSRSDCVIDNSQTVTSCRALSRNQCMLPAIKKLPEIWQWCGEQVECVTVWECSCHDLQACIAGKSQSFMNNTYKILS